MNKRIVEIDLDALMKKTKSIENKQAKELKTVKQQYNKVVEQNKTLQAERNAYKNILEEIREMAKYDCEYECANSNENCTIKSCLEKRIQRKINKVL